MTSSMHEAATVRAAAATDAAAIARIYNHYVASTIVTFEEEPVSAAEIGRRLARVRVASLPWLVAEEGDGIVGYACAMPWKARSAYRFSAEISAYVAAGATGRGIGTRLYTALLPMLQACGLHVVVGGIALPNEASVALHQRFGLRKVAHFEEVGFKLNRWVDVGYWQRTL